MPYFILFILLWLWIAYEADRAQWEDEDDLPYDDEGEIPIAG